MTKKSLIYLIGCVVLAVSSASLLNSDYSQFLIWWAAVMLIGIGFYPLTSRLFSSFRDKGWIFSKVLGILIGGYVVWALVCADVLPFTGVVCFTVTVLCVCAVWLWHIHYASKKTVNAKDPEPDLELILLEEMIFLGFFLMWTYFAGFRPEALSTEKFMDYGFMAAMMRDTSLPFSDMWYAGETMNYYYGGQYFAVFLTKLTGTDVHVTYNIARALVGGFVFALPFSIVSQMFRDRARKVSEGLCVGGGLMAGVAVSLAGNMHYVLYGLFGDVFKLSGYESYWFPSSTRYIGHNPENMDQTIHEFPSYSLVLGDLHAHLVNLMFVLLLLGLLYVWMKKQQRRFEEGLMTSSSDLKTVVLGTLKDPYLWILAFLTGVFKFTNYWDFYIYMTVCCIAFALIALRFKVGTGLERAYVFVVRIIVMLVVSTLSAIPFTATFDMITTSIALAKNHSAFYQLVVLWGLPSACVVCLLIFVIAYTKKRRPVSISVPESPGEAVCGAPEDVSEDVPEDMPEEVPENVPEDEEKEPPVVMKRGSFLGDMKLSDMFALLMGICAMGLILTIEVIYARDIYEATSARANTMFKLSYQAYIMFGMSMIYGLLTLLGNIKHTVLKVVPAVLTMLFVLTCGYFWYAVNCWYGNVLDPDNYRQLNATAYLVNEMPEDAEAIYWLDENIEGLPVVLEADGTSYTTYCRVSAMTGLPTVSGWYTHEWLWRENTAAQNARNADVMTIYTSNDAEEIRALIEKYDIEYIFVGSCEREKYEDLNEEMLKSLGEVVFEGTTGEHPAYVIKVYR